jgi:hypothetical protein
MVGIVNGVLPVPLIQRAQAPAHASVTGATAALAGPASAASEPFRSARRAEMESLLASLAVAPTGIRDMATRLLQEAERKLVRLRAEAQAARAAGDRKAAERIARELVVLARQIADAAQDYAVAETAPDFVSPALAKAAARTRAEGGAAPATLVGEAEAAASDATQAAAAEDDPSADRPDPREAAGEAASPQPADREPVPGSPVTRGPGSAEDESVPGMAHRLLEAAEALLGAMEQLAGRRSSRALRTDQAL